MSSGVNVDSALPQKSQRLTTRQPLARGQCNVCYNNSNNNNNNNNNNKTKKTK